MVKNNQALHFWLFFWEILRSPVEAGSWNPIFYHGVYTSQVVFSRNLQRYHGTNQTIDQLTNISSQENQTNDQAKKTARTASKQGNQTRGYGQQ